MASDQALLQLRPHFADDDISWRQRYSVVLTPAEDCERMYLACHRCFVTTIWCGTSLAWLFHTVA